VRARLCVLGSLLLPLTSGAASAALEPDALPEAARDLVGPDWHVVQGEGASRYVYEPLRYSTETWYGSTFWTGPDWCRVGRDWQHSGEQVNSVRLFTAPQPGHATITGRVYKADTNGGDGVAVAIRVGRRTVWTAEIEAADAQGVTPDVAVDLVAGDHVWFVLAKRGEITCDTTHWDPVIAYDDGTAFRASEGFNDQPGVWSYEMEHDLGEQAGLAEGWEVSQLTTPDGSRGVLLVARPTGEVSEQTVRLGELVPAQAYAVRDVRSGESAVRTGDDLARTGLALALPHGGSRLFTYEPTAAAPATAVPAAPAGLRAAATQGAMVLTWGEVQGATSYVIWRDGEVVSQVSGPPRYVDAAVTASQPHRYAVEAECHLLRSKPAVTAVGGEQRPEMALWAMVEEDWIRSDGLERAPADWRAAAAAALEGARQLAERVRELEGAPPFDAELQAVERLQSRVAALAAEDRDRQRDAYLQARWLQRRIALANPLVRCGPLLFVKRVPASYSHLVMQYFGWRARPGGGLYVLEQPGQSLRTRALLEGQLEGGSVLDPCLSWDAQRVVFSYSSCAEPDPFFHIYEVGAGGAGLPDGGIVFCSTRRRGYARCFGAQFGDRWHVYTLHRMDADGGNLRTLSYHETNEWFPSVLADGSIAYARWDYVDRHAVLHQNLWVTNPDGTHPRVLWGNHTEVPHCSFEAQPIPGTRRLLCTGSAHHSITGGSLFIVDPDVDCDGPAAIERITPEVPFPEAEAWPGSYYATPWPLSADFYLVSYSHERLIPEPDPNGPAALGLYYLDRWGHRELLYRDPQIGCTSPIPLRPRERPPVIPSLLPIDATDEGEVVLLDVHRGLPAEYAGQVRALRVIQVLPKATPVADAPPVGLAGQEPTKMVLGTVPVETDGSAHFVVPARRPILFQALDERGLAIQTMRSITYLHPGEQVSCVGCHEPRTTSPGPREALATRRAPSVIAPGPDGTRPFSYPRLVQPVLDRYCVRCHGSQDPPQAPDLTGAIEGNWTKSYLSLTGGLTFYQAGTNEAHARESLVPRYGGWNSVHLTPPGGLYGARGSRLMQMLLVGHHDVTLDPESLERLATWVDANALFYGTYDPAEQAKQLRGEVISEPPLQ